MRPCLKKKEKKEIKNERKEGRGRKKRGRLESSHCILCFWMNAELKQLMGTQRQLGCQAQDPALVSLFGIPVKQPLLSVDTLHLFHGYGLIL